MKLLENIWMLPTHVAQHVRIMACCVVPMIGITTVRYENILFLAKYVNERIQVVMECVTTACIFKHCSSLGKWGPERLYHSLEGYNMS